MNMTREQALQDIKAKMDYYESDKRLRAAIETLVPELAESEDERITRAINNMLPFIPNEAYANNGVTKEDVLNWLGKQKYNRMKPIYDNQESFESALEKAWKEYNDSGSRTVDSCEDDYVECAHAKGFREGYLFGLEKQKEQKPVQTADEKVYIRIIKSLIADFIRDKKPEYVAYYQKIYDWLDGISSEKKTGPISCGHENGTPVDWSKNDTVFLNEIIDFFENKTVKLQHDIDMYAHWLKSLPERFNLQPKQEWSEKDSLLEKCLQETENATWEIRNRLKSLRPHWKSSEDDIKMLEHIIGQYEIGNKNSKVMGYLPRVEELDFLKKVLAKWKNLL